MLDCLHGPARRALQQRGGDLVVARGTPEQRAAELAARARRDGRLLRLRRLAVRAAPRPARSRRRCSEAGVEPRRTPGNFVADIGKAKPYAVFTPFWRAWKELPRREVHGAPAQGPDARRT